jgi:hypothetical protein
VLLATHMTMPRKLRKTWTRLMVEMRQAMDRLTVATIRPFAEPFD